MTAQAYVVDFRSELARMDAFLSGRGGIVHVPLRDKAPASLFSKKLRMLMAEDRWPYPWTDYQIDPENPETHYVGGIIQGLADTLGAVLAQPPPVPMTDSLHLLNDATIGGDAIITNVSIGSGDQDPAVSRNWARARAGELGAHLAAHLSAGRRFAVVCYRLEKWKRRDFKDFWSTLWEPVLAELVPKGLLLIDFSDPSSDNNLEGDWPPPPDAVIDLPERLDSSAKREAVEDIGKILLAEGVWPSGETAEAAARTMVALEDNIRLVHADLTRVIALRDEKWTS